MKHLVASLLLGAALASGAMSAAPAQTEPGPLAPVLARLEAEGYQIIDTHRSWFGRLVVVSTRDGLLREVVLNRTTGAVLSDRLFADPGAGSGARGADDPDSGHGGSRDDGGAATGGSDPKTGTDKSGQQRAPGGNGKSG